MPATEQAIIPRGIGALAPTYQAILVGGVGPPADMFAALERALKTTSATIEGRKTR